jgi:phage replication O-like protein O
MKKQNIKKNLIVSTKFAKIPNEVLEKLCAFEHGSSALRVLIFIIRKTYGYSKTTDCLSLKQIEEATRLSNRTVCRAMRLLKDKGYITIAKDKDFRKHIPNQVTIVLGRGGVLMENHKLNEQMKEKDELWKLMDELDDDEETTVTDDSSTTDTDDSSFYSRTTDSQDSRTTVTDGVHKRHCKDIEEEEKKQRQISPLGFPTRKPRGKPLRDSLLDDLSISCDKSPTKEIKTQRTPEQQKLIEDNFKLIARTPYLYDLVKREKPIERWQIEAALRIERDGGPYARKRA